jgi:hypothetical protein
MDYCRYQFGLLSVISCSTRNSNGALQKKDA